MTQAPRAASATDEQARRISAEIERERPRLRGFIRRRVADEADVEDILQDVFSELVEAYRLMQPIEQVSAWLYQVARNRIIDRFRRHRREALVDLQREDDEGEMLGIDELLPSPEAGPEAAYMRARLLETLDQALAELPGTQQAVFVAHELDGMSFRQLAEETGLSINTLLSRKHYAVRHLRKRLQAIYDEFDIT